MNQNLSVLEPLKFPFILTVNFPCKLNVCDYAFYKTLANKCEK